MLRKSKCSGPAARRRLAPAAWALALLAGAAACDWDPAAPGEGPGVHVTSKLPLEDTIFAGPIPLSVQVTDSAGRPAAGLTVLFESVPFAATYGPQYRGLLVEPGSGFEAARATATTNARGNATISLKFRSDAGTGTLLVRVPELGYRDSVHFTVAPGSPAGISIEPRDSTLYPGGSYALRAVVTDVMGNPRPETATYAALSGPVSVVASNGSVTGSEIGRGAVVARWKELADTAYVSVAPRGVLASQLHEPGNGGPRGLFLTELDGTARQKIASGIDNIVTTQGLSWSPDGRELVFTRENEIRLLVPGETEQVLAEFTASVGGARFSRDGAWIYFGFSGFRQDFPGLFRIRRDGTGLERLGEVGRDILPSPSPDGRYLAYVSDRSPCGVDACIRILDVAANHDTDFFLRGTHAAWSPVADRIAVVSERRVLLVRPDGGQERVLMDGVFDVRWIDWSPDGQWVVLSSPRETVTLVRAEDGLVLPLGHLLSHGTTVWRP